MKIDLFAAGDYIESVMQGEFADRLMDLGLDFPDAETFGEFVRSGGKSHTTDKVTKDQIIAALKIFCEITSVVCPMINDQ